MPVVGVNRDKLFEALGQEYSKYIGNCPYLRDETMEDALKSE